MSLIKKRKTVEELLFIFVSKNATVSDFSFYLEAINNYDYFNIHSFKKIENFFREYFVSDYSKYVDTVLKEHPQILEQLYQKYFNLDPNELLTQIHEYFSNGKENVDKVVKYSIDNIFVLQKMKLPEKLLFYLFIFQIVQSKQENIFQKLEILWKVLKIETDIKKLIEFPSSIDIKLIDQQQLWNSIINSITTDSNCKFIMAINIFKYISYPINENDFKEEFQVLCSNSIIKDINLLKIPSSLTILLEFVDLVINPNISIYFHIFQSINERTIAKEINKDYQKIIFTWISNKIISLNINLSSFYQLKAIYIPTIIEVMNKENLCQPFLKTVLPQMFYQLVNEEKKECNLIHFYNHFRCTINAICLETNNYPFELKLSAFYSKLLSKIYKKQTLIDKLSYIRLNTNTDKLFDINFIFTYMHSELRNNLKQNEDINNLITKIENKQEINFNQTRLSNFESSEINQQLNINAIQYIKLPFNDNIALQDQINGEECSKNYPVLCIEISNVTNSQINESWCINNSIIQINSLNQEERFYVLKGAFYIHNGKEKELMLYEKTSQCWYSFSHNKWKKSCFFPNINSLSLIYLRRSKLKFKNDFTANLNEIQVIPQNDNNELYWKIFLNICEINPNIILNNIDIFYKWNAFNSITNLQKFYSFLENKNLHNNQTVQILLQKIIEKRRKLINEKKFHPEIIKIEKSYYYLKPNTFFKKLQSLLQSKNIPSYDFEFEQTLWNLRYYLDNIEHIKNIPSILVFHVTFLYCLSKITKKETFEFLHNNLKKMKMIPEYNSGMTVFLNDAFNKASYINGFDNVIRYWKNKKITVLEDYKWKFLCELLIFYCEDIFVSNENKMNDNQKSNTIDKLESFVLSNQVLLSVKNINDNDVTTCLKFLYDILKIHFEKEDIGTYRQLMKICFELIQEKTQQYETFQLTDFQQLVFQDYLRYCLGNSNFLLNNNADTIINKLYFVSKFLTNYSLQFYFANVLLKLKKRKDSFDKKIKPLLINMFKYYNTKEYCDLKHAIVYYLFYCKIERIKNKINKMTCIQKTNHNMDIHLLFSFMNKKILQLLKESQNDNIISSLYKDFQEGKELNLSNECFNNLPLNKELELIESSLQRKIFLIKNEPCKISSSFPTDLLNEESSPHIIYKYHKKPFSYTENMEFSNRNYILKGIILKSPEGKEILLKNLTNEYWYSFYDRKWMNSLKNSINPTEMISVFFLKEESEFKSLIFEDLQNETEPELFTYYISEEMKWLMDNAINDLSSNKEMFCSMFNLNKQENKAKLFELKVDWNNIKISEFKQYVSEFN